MFEEMLKRLDASSGRIEMRFPYFIRKAAPVSGVESLLDYDATVIVDQPEGGESRPDAARDGAGHQPVPVLEEDFRIRRAQPALAHHPGSRAACRR